MTNHELFEACLVAAEKIVAAERALYPNSEGVVALKVSGGVSNTSNEFARSGTTQNDTSYTLPVGLTQLLNDNAAQASPNASLASNIGSLLSTLVTQDPSNVPSKSALTTILGLSPSAFDGASTLRGIAARNPYSASFEQDTEDSFKDRAGVAMAQVQSGPNMVRGGTARPGFAQAELATNLARERGREVRDARNQDIGNVLQASQLLNLLENARRGMQLQAQSAHAGQTAQRQGNSLQAANAGETQKATNVGILRLASDLLGTRKNLTTDALSGKGTENRSYVSGEGGLSCCFILLTALNGRLPWYVNLARKDYLTANRKAGYRWMASWLVPWMQRSETVMGVVNAVMVKPFLRYGAALYGASRRKTDWLFAPLCEGWLAVWSVLGYQVRKG